MMLRRYATAALVSLLFGGLLFAGGSPVSAQMGPGMMGGQGMMGPGQASAMPMQQIAEVMKQLADRLASGRALDGDKAERVRRLVDQLAAFTRQMVGGGMMGQGSEQMREASRILTQISELLRDQ